MTSSILRAGNPVIVRAAPFAAYIAFLALNSFFTTVDGHWDLRWLYGIKVAVVAALLGIFWRSYDELHLPILMRARDWLIAAGIGIAVFILWINLDGPWVTLGTSTGFNPTDAEDNIKAPLA